MLRVLLVTSWGTACGIAAYAELLKASVEAADRGIEVIPVPGALDPDALAGMSDLEGALVHLNHHDALHSRWTPEHVRALVAGGVPVLVTYHDTTANPSPTSKLAQLAQVASSVIVHEPLHPESTVKAIYWRQGVPGPTQDPVRYHSVWAHHPSDAFGQDLPGQVTLKAFPQQPVLGTVGFPFPWKNYDRLAQVTAEAGWALVLLAPNATAEDEARWRALNSSILVRRDFLPQDQVVSDLAGCDATAFMYECANTGTSGAIRQGLAARKPVIALQTCRQFRDLYLYDASGDSAPTGIDWVSTWDEFRHLLGVTYPGTFHPRISRFAHAESWQVRGQQHAQLYRMLVGVEGSTI